MLVYIFGSYWKIFKGNVYQNYYDKFRVQIKVFFLIFDSDGWVDCWIIFNVVISIGYNYYLVFVFFQQVSADEEFFIVFFRFFKYFYFQFLDNFDLGEMDFDLIVVELEVVFFMFCVYGLLLRNFFYVKVILFFFWFLYSIY